MRLDWLVMRLEGERAEAVSRSVEVLSIVGEAADDPRGPTPPPSRLRTEHSFAGRSFPQPRRGPGQGGVSS